MHAYRFKNVWLYAFEINPHGKVTYLLIVRTKYFKKELLVSGKQDFENFFINLFDHKFYCHQT